jgi:hypothetical protein
MPTTLGDGSSTLVGSEVEYRSQKGTESLAKRLSCQDSHSHFSWQQHEMERDCSDTDLVAANGNESGGRSAWTFPWDV